MIFIIQLIFFVLLILACFTASGIFLLEQFKTKLSFWEKLILGTTLGWVIFTFIGYILLVLNLKFLILAIYSIIFIFYLKKFNLAKYEITVLPKKLLIIFIPIFIAGIIMQLLIISPSGIEINGEVLFWSSHAHDGSWHIALMNQMEKGWPIQNPAFAGEKLVNYHFFSDIAPMYLSYLFKLPLLDLYFRFLPLFYAIIFGSLAYLLGKKITKSFWGGFWSLIFADFAGSFGYIVTFLKDRVIGGEAIFWSAQPQSTIGNPPQISAIILILAFFYLFSIYLENKSKHIFLILVLIAGSLIVFKVYAGIALLGGLAVCGIWQIIKDKKIEFFLLFILSAALSAILFLPNTAKSQSLLIFQPWWYIRTIIVAPDRLGQVEWELRRQTYISEENWKRVIQLELQGFLIFFLGNLGMRFLSLFILPKYLKTFFKNYFNQLLLSVSLISLIFPILFIQRGETAGTSQFFQYYILIFGIFAAEAIVLLSQRIKSLILKIIFAVLIILLAIPTQLGLLANFYHRSAFAKIDSEEKQALLFLTHNTPQNSIIVTPLFNKYLNLNLATPPIWGWSDSVYVGAFSKRAIYLADQAQVENTGYDYQGRKELEDKLFTTDDPELFNTLINKTHADYLYFPILQKPKVDLSQTLLSKVFSNSVVEIWKI